MKLSSVALAAVLSIGHSTTAFFLPTTTPSTSQASSFQLKSLAAPPNQGKGAGRSEAEIQAELSSGKVLEGGKVIDFEAIQGPSRAEEALLESKNGILQSGQKYIPAGNSILGINDDVIAEVGHELGQFATNEEIQNCALYLRSQAPVGLFEPREQKDEIAFATFSVEQKEQFDQLLRKAYEESGEVTSAFAKTFYLGTQLLEDAPREAIWAIYVWCRRTDEIVDAPRDSDKEMLDDLASWEMRLENLWKYGAVEDVYDLCLLDVLVKYPSLPITPFTDMIRGMLMDVPGLGQERYDTFDELHLYCYRVAGTVGLMSLPVFGCAEGYNDVVAK